jgi:hypothetical protein
MNDRELRLQRLVDFYANSLTSSHSRTRLPRRDPIVLAQRLRGHLEDLGVDPSGLADGELMARFLEEDRRKLGIERGAALRRYKKGELLPGEVRVWASDAEIESFFRPACTGVGRDCPGGPPHSSACRQKKRRSAP